MILTRIVSGEMNSFELLSQKLFKKIQILLWQDSVTDEVLMAMSHEGKICPAILAWRELLKKSAA